MSYATLSVTAYSTVTMLLAFFHKVAQSLQMLKCLRGAWSSTCLRNTMFCIGVCFNESTSICKVSDWSFSICASLFLVDYVRIHHHYFHNPKKIWIYFIYECKKKFMEKTIIANKLVHLVNTQHVLIVVNHNYWLLCCWRSVSK